MVRSELIADDKVLVHSCFGAITILDISTAMVISALHPNLPVVWDFIESERETNNEAMLELTSPFLKSEWFKASDKKRAFVLAKPEYRTAFTESMGRASAPWPWAVFPTLDDAVMWALD